MGVRWMIMGLWSRLKKMTIDQVHVFTTEGHWCIVIDACGIHKQERNVLFSLALVRVLPQCYWSLSMLKPRTCHTISTPSPAGL